MIISLIKKFSIIKFFEHYNKQSKKKFYMKNNVAGVLKQCDQNYNFLKPVQPVQCNIVTIVPLSAAY